MHFLSSSCGLFRPQVTKFILSLNFSHTGFCWCPNILQEKSADPSNKRDVKNIGKGIVIDEYNVMNNNCVTTSLNAIQAVGIDVSSIVAISPAQLLTKMQNALKASKSNWLIRLLMGETGQPPFYETEIDK